MKYSVNLVDLLGVAIATVCLAAAWQDLSGKTRKLWRLGVAPVFGNAVSLIILAGAVASLQHDLVWIATFTIGVVTGAMRGRRIVIQADQVWGTVKTPEVRDAAIAALGIMAIAVVDGTSGLFNRGALPSHGNMAAASALFSGYLAGRAWILMRRASNASHVDLGAD